MAELSVRKIAIGYDRRQMISFVTLVNSIVRRAKAPVAIYPLVIDTLPLSNEKVGLTPFTYTRWLTPWLCGDDLCLFLDVDIMCLGDINELFDWVEEQEPRPVWVVKHDKKFEWPSVMMFDRRAAINAELLHPTMVEKMYKELPSFDWAGGRDAVGALPAEWNHLVLYDPPDPDAKLVHFTAGIPVWPETKGCEFTKEYKEEAQHAMSAQSWKQLMGNSIHTQVVKDHLVASGRMGNGEAKKN